MRHYFPALVWTALIHLFASDLLSSSHTGGLVQMLARLILGHPLADLPLELTQFTLRKLAHLTAYGILGWLWFRAMRGEQRGWTLRWSLLAAAISLFVAMTDELHQSFVPSRTGSALDVVIDFCGAVIAQLITARRR